MKNKIHYVSKIEMASIIKTLQKGNSIYIAEMNGRTVQCELSFFSSMNELFRFPIPVHGFDGYFDMIRDLDWLTKDGYVLVINNFSEFMNSNLTLKRQIIKDFEDIVLPWWEEEVIKCVVEGVAKSFNLYLVD